VGGLAEDHVPGALVGPLVWTVLRLQFQALRDGDRFWYERQFRGDERHLLEATTLADIIRRNTSIGRELPGDVFCMGGRTGMKQVDARRPVVDGPKGPSPARSCRSRPPLAGFR
jgi:hypothetical protein